MKNLRIKKFKISTSALGTCLILSGSLLFNNKPLVAISATESDSTYNKILEKQEMEVEVFVDSNGNYVIPTSVFNDESLEKESFKCLDDVNGDGVISIAKELVEKNDGGVIATVQVEQKTKQPLIWVQAVHHYKNYSKGMEYTVTDVPKSLVDNDEDKDRDLGDVIPGKYQNNKFDNVVYKLDEVVITHNDNTVQIDYYYIYE